MALIQLFQLVVFYVLSLYMQVTDSKGHTLYTREEAEEGKFAFTTDDYDTYEICFMTKVPAGEKENENTEHDSTALSYFGKRKQVTK